MKWIFGGFLIFFAIDSCVATQTDSVVIRGHTQTLHVFGTRGDGGWIHLAPHVAKLLAAKATDPSTQGVIGSVIGLGLRDQNELGWRLKDSIVYMTHAVPNEPLFSVADLVATVTPVPLTAIHSAQDEFVPLAEVQHILKKANPQKNLWVVLASDHRFSNSTAEFDQTLLEAPAWVKQNQSR